MSVTLHGISREKRAGYFDLSVSFGDKAPESYLAFYDGKGCVVDESLFMRLSCEAQEQFSDCTLYHEELLWILVELHEGRPAPVLPVHFGSTKFCPRRPGMLRMGWRRFRHLLQRPTRGPSQ